MLCVLKIEESWEKDAFGRWDINKYIIEVWIKPQGREFVIPYWEPDLFLQSICHVGLGLLEGSNCVKFVHTREKP